MTPPLTSQVIDRAQAAALARGSAHRLRLACNMHQREVWHDDDENPLDIAHLLTARGLTLDALVCSLAHHHEVAIYNTTAGPHRALSGLVADARTELQIARSQLAAPRDARAPSRCLGDATDAVAALTRRVRCTLERTALRAPSTPAHLARTVQQVNEALQAIAAGHRASALAATMFAAATLESEIVLRSRLLGSAPGS